MTSNKRKWLVRAAIGIAVIAAAALLWNLFHKDGYGPGIASGNGRLEATETLVAAKAGGRIAEILVNEGDKVTKGQIVARMDTSSLEAELERARAQKIQAETTVASADAEVAQQVSNRAAALAAVRQREAELQAARRRHQRSTLLAAEGGTARQEADDDASRVATSQAQLEAARAQVAAADAAIAATRSKSGGAKANVSASQAAIQRVEADIADAVLRAPRDARVQYRVAETGEVVAAGGTVLSLADLGDVQMTFFLPAADAGRLAVGSEARLVLDAWPDSVLVARVSHVADVAQFTPKEVETQNEREKMMFRVRARLSPDVAAQLKGGIKSGLTGVAHVRVDAAAEWPDDLAVRQP